MFHKHNKLKQKEIYMNKKVQEFLTQHNLAINGNNAYGVYNDFETNFVYASATSQYPLFFHFTCYATEQQRQDIMRAIADERFKYLTAEFSLFGLSVAITGITLSSAVKTLEETLNRICSIMKEYGALGVGYCPVCGQTLNLNDSKKCNINGITVSMDNNCVDTINAQITEENKNFQQAPNNYLRGFAGAVLGALAGVAIAVVLYLLNFISALSSFVAVMLGALLYKKFGGKPDKMMIVIVTATSFVMMMLTVPVIYIVASGIAATENGLNISAFEAFRIVLADAEGSKAFYLDLALTFVFTALGCGLEIFELSKSIKRQKNI